MYLLQPNLLEDGVLPLSPSPLCAHYLPTSCQFTELSDLLSQVSQPWHPARDQEEGAGGSDTEADQADDDQGEKPGSFGDATRYPTKCVGIRGREEEGENWRGGGNWRGEGLR